MAEGKRVLVLGAGLVTGPLVQYLSDHGFKVTVASRTLSKAQELCVNAPNATALALDVEKPEDMERLEGLTQDADAVISMLPYLFHVQAAKLAIKHKKHFLTTSYVSDAMQELDQAARDAGIAMINECGVDPGTDHMSAMRVIDDVRRRGGKIVSFTSLCGGLPMPIDNNNPLGYKFSWAPRGVLLASLNKARFLKDGEIQEWDSDKVFSGEHLVHIDELGLDLEMYPNRNSLPYKDVYQIDSAQTILRGTFRYPGWSQTILSLIRLGWLNLEDSADLAGKSYRQVTLELLSKDGRDGLHEGEDLRAGVARVLALDASIEKKILDNFKFLGLFSEEQKIPAGTRTRLDGICSAMLGKEEMEYKPNERDMIVMQHKYIAEFPAEEGKKENITTTLISYGLAGGFSAMARTVTYPVAIATRLLLEGKIEQRGIIRPTTPELYNPILDELENSFGIKFVDVYQ